MPDMHTSDKAASLRILALQRFRHQHEWNWPTPEIEQIEKENCQACALTGFEPNVEDPDAPAPNIANWARDYVCAGRTIPRMFRAAFENDRTSTEFPQAANQLRLDINTFGVTFSE